MSDTYLRIIPTDPNFVPPRKAQGAACDYLQKLLLNPDGVRFLVTNEVEFVDAGENFERVRCSKCGAEIGLDWWTDAMDSAFKYGQFEIDMTVPCCGKKSNLNDLQYEMPQGFSKSVLEASNPNTPIILEENIQSLARILGCELRVIWSRY